MMYDLRKSDPDTFTPYSNIAVVRFANTVPIRRATSNITFPTDLASAFAFHPCRIFVYRGIGNWL